jgi:hypothetical protein
MPPWRRPQSSLRHIIHGGWHAVNRLGLRNGGL